MILQIFIGLLALASVSLFVTQGRYKRVWSVLLLCGLSVISYFFVINFNTGNQTGFIYQWLPYDMIKADFSISTSENIQHMLKPLIFMLSGLVYLNTIFKGEQHPLRINTLLILNFIALILLLSSHDFLQLMFAGSMFSVVGFYMSDTINPKKNIFIFSFLAETAIFMALTVVYGSTHSVSLDSLPQFAINGHHKDIVSGLLLFAIGCKSGLLLLNGHYFNLKNISSNRIVGIMLLSIPISAFGILIKVKPLLDATPLCRQVLPIWIYCSLATFIIIALFNNNIKSKMISLLLFCISFSLHFIYKDITLLYKLIPYILCISFFISVSFIIIYNSASKETDISYLGGFWRITKQNMILCLLLLFTSIAIFSRMPLNIYEKIFTFLFIITISSVFRRVFYSKPCKNEAILSNARNIGLLYSIPLIVVCCWFLWQTEFLMYKEFYWFSATSILSMIFVPSLKIDVIGRWSIWQDNFLSRFYEAVFIRPLKLFGRILWLAFDVMVIERGIINSISHLSKNIISGMHTIQEKSKYSWFFSMLIGIFIVVIYFFKDIYK